ncbi:MAG TPA: AI-2E family transporter [Candidatus Angelobacter sp.]|nr:AI-2E family transporter [Candidatus Angelobacter sp.]
MQNHRSDIVFFFCVLITLWIAYSVRDVLLLIYVSALFAVVLSPAIGLIQKFRVNGWRAGRGFAIVFLMLMMLLLGTLLMVFAFPPIYHEARQFSSDWPKHVAALSEEFQHLPFGQKIDPAELQKLAREIVGGAGSLFLNLAGGIFGTFTVIILTAYFTIDGERTLQWVVSLFPLHQQNRLTATLLRANKRMRNWLMGQAIMMLSMGAASLAAYYALHLKYFYILAMFAGIADIVPIAGPISALVIAGSVAAMDSPEKVIGVLIFHAVYAQFEAAFLSPHIMRTTLKLSPLAVIIALALGGSLAGVIGALASVPTAALVLVLADEYLVKKTVTAATAD